MPDEPTKQQEHEEAEGPVKFEPITSQEQLNRVLGERISRERAKFADYEELKAKAGRLAELERAQMTETERAEVRIRAAEERAAQLEAANARQGVAIEYGLAPDDAALLEGVTDLEAMRRLADRLAKQAREEAAPRPPRPNPAQREGDVPAESKDAIARAFFGI